MRTSDERSAEERENGHASRDVQSQDSSGPELSGDLRDGYHLPVEPLDVRPAEQEPESPWPLGQLFPPCFTMDYGDAADGLVAIRAGSLRGNSHLALSQPRQDSYQVVVDESHIHIAVADGVGSQDRSELGSAIAARRAVQLSVTGARPAEIAGAVADSLLAEAASIGCDPVSLSTTLCWARIAIGQPSSPWDIEAAEWGDSELLVYDTRELRDGHPNWRRLQKRGHATANSVLALPMHQVIQAKTNSAKWHPGQVIGLYSDGIAADIRHDTVLGHALAKEWYRVPSPWEFMGQMAFRYRPANDDRTAVALWRRDGEPQAWETSATAGAVKPERPPTTYSTVSAASRTSKTSAGTPEHSQSRGASAVPEE